MDRAGRGPRAAQARTAAGWWSTASTSRSARARSSACSAPTAPARPRRSSACRGCARPTAARSGCSASTPRVDGTRLRALVGSQQQDSALPDRLRVGEAVDAVPPPRLAAPDGLLAAFGLAGTRRTRVRRAVRRPAAAAVPGARAAQPAAAGGARRADPGPGPGRPPGRLGRRPGAAGRRHHGAAGHPLHGRGRGAVRPGRGARGPAGSWTPAPRGSWSTGTRRGRRSGSAGRADRPWPAQPGVREVRRDGGAVELHGDRSMVAYVGAELVRQGRVPDDLAVVMPDLEAALVGLLSEEAAA